MSLKAFEMECRGSRSGHDAGGAADLDFASFKAQFHGDVKKYTHLWPTDL